jgi:mono/diheme cytochrome c family protein
MNYENPEIQPKPPASPHDALQPGAPDFVETPDVGAPPLVQESLPIWLYIVCGFALFMAGSSFAGFGTFGLGLYDQGPGAPLATGKGQQTAAASTDPMVVGKKFYNNNCANCHQASGVGQPGSYPTLAGSEWVLGSKERLAAIMLHGIQGPLTVNNATFGTQQMPGWSGKSDDQLASVMTYIRASWGNTADAVTPDVVSAARAKFASQSAAYSEADLLKIAPHGTEIGAKK